MLAAHAELAVDRWSRYTVILEQETWWKRRADEGSLWINFQDLGSMTSMRLEHQASNGLQY